jgi:tetratricopeptide (TPR) repeat protein
MRPVLAWCVAAILAAAGTRADAAWLEAKSRHFIIYANDSPKALNEFAAKLERFDQAARLAMNVDDPPVGNGNRLTVFVVPTEADIRTIVNDKTGTLAGFYTGRVSGSLAYVPKRLTSDISRDTVFYHEYTHHLMMQDLDRPYPEWYVEGFAEFFSTPKFDKDGGVWFGLPDNARAWGLFNGPSMPVESLVAGLKPNLTAQQRDVFYGRGWLLSHYLLMEPGRKGQLAAYIADLSNGGAQLEAARRAFGDLKQLDRELDSYRTKRLLAFKIGASKIHVGPIDVTPLSTGASQVILMRTRIKFGADKQTTERFAAQVRQIEDANVGDDLVETTLALAELSVDHFDAAEAAANRALKTNPRDTEAMVLEGKAIEKKARAGDWDKRHPAFEQARQIFIAANKVDTEDPEPLMEFYLSFLLEGVRPTDNAIAALHYASDLAPQDLGVRMNSAIAYLNEGKPKEARSTLTLVAYSPHSAEMADTAKAMIDKIDAGDSRAALTAAAMGATQKSQAQ